MEPRPPRPRSSRPFETPGSPDTSGIGERLYPGQADPAYYANAEAYGPGGMAEGPLLPRRQRRQRGLLRAVLGTLVAVALIAALGWFFRDAIRGAITPSAPAPTVVSDVTSPGTPTSVPAVGQLPNALATVTPTAASATATSRPASTSLPAGATEPAAANGDISAQTRPLLDFLPAQDQVPAGLILSNEAERSKAEVVDSLGGTEEASQLLDDWGWSGNAFRDFVVPEGTDVAPGATTFLNFSVHRFADAAAAANALTFFSDQVVFGQGLQDVEAPAIGENARLLVGPPLAVLYVQQGPIMYRIGGSANSADGDPTADVLSVANAIIPGRASGG